MNTLRLIYMPVIFRSSSNNSFFFFNDTATTEIYTLSLHDALPIRWSVVGPCWPDGLAAAPPRSEEHTSELQSRENLVCRLLLEKKKKNVNLSSYEITYKIKTNKKHTNKRQ